MVIINTAWVRWWEKQFDAVAVQLGPPAGLEDIHTWEYMSEVVHVNSPSSNIFQPTRYKEMPKGLGAFVAQGLQPYTSGI